MTDKVFKQAKNHPDYYVSNDGEVLSFKRNKQGRLLKPQKQGDGYFQVYVDGRLYSVHRLVAETFIDNPHNLETVNHINHVKTDNRVENLEWMSREDNIRDARQKTYVLLLAIDASFIGVFKGQKALADQIGVSKKTIGNMICRRRKKINDSTIFAYKQYLIIEI